MPRESNSICSAGVTGTAGLSFLRGTDPVIATAMIIGVMFPMPVLHIRMIASDLHCANSISRGACAPPAKQVLAAPSGNFRRNDIRTASQPCHGERAYESQHGASCDVDRGRGDYAGSLDHCGRSQWRKPRQDGDAQIVGKRNSTESDPSRKQGRDDARPNAAGDRENQSQSTQQENQISLPPVISDQIGITVTINNAVPTRRMM